MKIKASVLIASLVASMACMAADTYQVSTSVYAKGKLVASPEVVVEANKAALITIGNDFSYNVKVTPNQDAAVLVDTSVTVGDDRINPSLTVALGREASIEIGEQKLTGVISKVGS